MAPLHLWALGEISACYLTHLDPSASSQEVAADAKLLDAYFGDYCVDFNVRFSPYTSLAVLAVENETNLGHKNQNADRIQTGV
jgi:hypothetical protein